jgi:hypothetical protein
MSLLVHAAQLSQKGLETNGFVKPLACPMDGTRTYQCNSINPMALAKQAGLMRNAAADDLSLAEQAAFMMDVESPSYR